MKNENDIKIKITAGKMNENEQRITVLNSASRQSHALIYI